MSGQVNYRRIVGDPSCWRCERRLPKGPFLSFPNSVWKRERMAPGTSATTFITRRSCHGSILRIDPSAHVRPSSRAQNPEADCPEEEDLLLAGACARWLDRCLSGEPRTG